jgi:hypothetical protein
VINIWLVRNGLDNIESNINANMIYVWPYYFLTLDIFKYFKTLEDLFNWKSSVLYFGLLHSLG